MAESFVFYKSFIECVRMFNEEQQLDILNALIDAALYDAEPNNPVVFMMMQNVNAAHLRYERAVENGAKGGRPSYVAPSEWQTYYSEHTQKETAEHFGISVDTLQRWIKSTKYKKPQNTAKPQNLTVTDTYTDTVTDTDTDTVSSIYINKNKGGLTGEPPKAPVIPLKDGETVIDGPHYSNNTGRCSYTIKTAEGRTVERYADS